MMLNEIRSIIKGKNKCHFGVRKESKEKRKNSLFDLMGFYLKYNQMKQWFEIVLIIIQLIQILSFPFSEKFQDVWRSRDLYKKIHLLFVYFKISPFVKGNPDLYFVSYNAVILFILFIFISLIVQIINISKGPIICVSFYRLIGSLLQMTSSVLFIPIIELLFSVLICNEGYNLYEIKSICWNGLYFLQSIIGGITLIYFICQTFVVINLLYESRPRKDTYSSKKMVKSDVILLFAKCLMVTTSPLSDSIKMTQVITGINTVVLLYLAYSYTRTSPYYSFQIQKTYLILSYCSTWTFLVLFIGNLAKGTSFNGSLEFCIIGNILIILGIILSNKQLNLELMLKTTIKSGNELIDQLEEITTMIINKDIRMAQIILQGYVQLTNEKTIDLDSPLRKYSEIEQDKKNIFYLMQHLNNLYIYNISKNPTNIRLRASYAVFLFEKALRKDQAVIELENAKRYRLALCEQFNLYRLNQIINEKTDSMFNTVNVLDLNEMFSNLSYKNLFLDFKESINIVSQLYIDFWNLLLNPQHNSQEELAMLNNLGTKINNTVESINENFNKMQKIKPYDYDILLYYFHYTNDILNDKDKAKILKNQLIECGDTVSSFDEINLCHTDLSSISSNDDYQYLIISAMNENLGTITHISISACTMLGYTREELIGKRIEILLPEMFMTSHQKYLSAVVDRYKRMFFEDYSSYQNFRIKFVDMHFYAKTKSRYLLPFNYKAAFFPNDNHKQYFYIKLLQDKANSAINNNQYMCYILTDNNLVIQNFSSNAMNLLGLNSNALNSSLEITDNIKELYEDFLQFLLDNDDTEGKEKESILNKAESKIQIIKLKYLKPVAATWVKSSNTTAYFPKLTEDFYKTNFNVNGSLGVLSSTKKVKFYNEKNIMIHVDEISFLENHRGLVFVIEPLWHYKLREKIINNPPLQSLKEVITPFTRKSQKNLLSDLGEDSKNNSKKNTLIKEYNQDILTTNKLDKTYIPELTKKFAINSIKSSYFQIEKNEKEEQNQKIKQQAEEKLNYLKKKYITESSDPLDSSDERSSDCSNSSNSHSQEYSDSLHESGKISKKISNNHNEDEYYNVKMEKIKFSIYNFSKNMIIEHPEYNKVSEVEHKINEDGNKLAKTTALLRQYSYSKYDSFNTQESNNSSKSLQKEKTKDRMEKTVNIQEEIFKKEISNALKRENIQTIVYLFYILSVFACFLVVGRNTAFLFQSLKFIDDIDETTYLIYSAVRLQNNIMISSYSIKDLILLNIPFYEMEDEDRDQYFKELRDYLNKDIFVMNIQYIANITTSPFQLKQDQITELDEKGGYYYTIDGNYNRQISNNTLKTTLELTNAALFHILYEDIDNIHSTNKDIFSYTFNSLNSLYKGLDLQIYFYFKNYDDLQMLILTKILSIFFVCEIVLTISFFVLRIGLVKVSKKNDSYLSIFFEISRVVIADSLDKCDLFRVRFNSEFKNDQSDEIEDNLVIQNENEVLWYDSSSSTKGDSNSKKSKMEKESNHHRFLGNFGKAYLGVLIGILFIVCYDIYLIFKIIAFKNETYKAISIYKSENIIQKHSMLVFTLMRELVFDSNTIFNFEPLSETIVSYFDFALDTYQKEKRNIDNIINQLPKLYSEIFYKINQQSICHYLKDTDFCQYITDKSGFYGLDQVILYAFDSTRFLYFRNLNVQNAQKAHDFKYNLTVYGTEEYNKYLPTDPDLIPFYNKIGPMYILNSELSLKIHIIISSIFFPAFKELINTISFGIDDNIKKMKFFYIISLSSSIGLLILLFITVWFPFIRQLNKTIYKTKNMLSIIPIEVLASLGNIYSLLEIERNLNQTDRDLIINIQKNNLNKTKSE